jgi:hypothetical protein
MVPELIQALAWSVFGLAFGWYICHALKEVDEIREVLVHHNGSGDGRGGSGGIGGKGGRGGLGTNGGQGGPGGVGGVGGQGSNSRAHQSSDKPRRALGIFMMLLAVAVGINAWYSTKQDRGIIERESRRSSCQAEFNADMARVLTIRNTYAEQDRAENLKMWDALLDPKATRESRLKAAEDFRDAMHRTEEARLAVPLPNLEDRDC